MKKQFTIPEYQLPASNSREAARYYISASEQDIQAMLERVGTKDMTDLYSHIDDSAKFDGPVELGDGMKYDELVRHLQELSKENTIVTNFIQDGLVTRPQSEVVGPVCDIRGLTTAYTPYQPERSQGTLETLWIYQSLLSEMTGFEAINASLYERSTAIFEALQVARRLTRKTKVLIPDTLHINDREVIDTMADQTELELVKVATNPETGLIDQTALQTIDCAQVAGVVIPQFSAFGTIEDVNTITDWAADQKIKSIAVIDPAWCVNGGLTPPREWGSKGTDMFVAEGQHLAIDPNYGGPGLGIFGIRFHQGDKVSIRQAPGRFIGKAKDRDGRECKAIILSTREQHIRRDKATSNICSNQSFLASLAGAAILNKGSDSFEAENQRMLELRSKLILGLSTVAGLKVAYSAPMLSEIAIEVSTDIQELIQSCIDSDVIPGVSLRGIDPNGRQILKIGINPEIQESEITELTKLLQSKLGAGESKLDIKLPETLGRRASNCKIVQLGTQEIVDYFTKLGEQNLSPDQGIYPLGSCTMKYNPIVNDYAAGLPGFTKLHPQAPDSHAQGALKILHFIQESFKSITGLPGVTTQPVAGAQGELVGIKLFQAYHRDRGENRDLLLIPRSAHGTNPATATVAGFITKKGTNGPVGILEIEANEAGEIDLDQVRAISKEHGDRIAGIMVTNPNTAGIFETNFKEMADIIHKAGGLVYMDGANMNAIAGHIDLNAIGVDAVHNNLHKTWTIPHGGGGPGDAIVAVSERLVDYLPGDQILRKANGELTRVRPPKCIGSFHRHHGNFAHKVRAYTYIKALGCEGIRKMSGFAVLSARYLYEELRSTFPTLPAKSADNPRMHEFIITLRPETFAKLGDNGTPKAQAIGRIGKLFLDFGFHAPTVAFPEPYGLMIEPTESYTKAELDQFASVIKDIATTLEETPQVLTTVPHFTPVSKVDELSANKMPILSEEITANLSEILPDVVAPEELKTLTAAELRGKILERHQSVQSV